MVRKTENTPVADLHDIADCRAADIGMADMGECLRSGPNPCSYALPFGYCFLCRHPRLREIISNTQQADSVPALICYK